jgi:uncharacterized SAM-binding protein YcdF (DUF218 family)
MIPSFLFLLAILSIWAAVAGRRGWVWLWGGQALVVSVLAGCGILPAFLLGYLQQGYSKAVTTDWRGHNVIVLLTGGNTLALNDPQRDSMRHPLVEPAIHSYSRIVRAYTLYRECHAAHTGSCTVLISGGDVQRYGHSEAEVYAQTLRSLGMPAAAIQLDVESRNTFASARNVATLLKVATGHPDYDHLWLVTSGFHLQRSMLDFAHFGMQPVPVRADSLTVKLTPWLSMTNLLYTEIALHEYLGMVQYYLILRWT